MEATLSPTLDTDTTTPTSKLGRNIGRVLSALPTLFLTFDGTIKLANIEPVVESCERMGIPNHLMPFVGALEVALVALHLVPRTAALGAVLLTGFLGGAVALHVRLVDPLFSHTLFPVYVGAFVWAGLYLRDARVRALVSSAR